jgi:hypothetical protein
LGAEQTGVEQTLRTPGCCLAGDGQDNQESASDGECDEQHRVRFLCIEEHGGRTLC